MPLDLCIQLAGGVTVPLLLIGQIPNVDSYRKSTPDKSFENNWSTKGNANLATGKAGTKVTPPVKKQ